MNAKILQTSKIVIFILIGILLSGCSLFGKKPITIVTEPTEKVRLELPDLEPLSPLSVNWVIVTPDNAEEVFNELKNSGQDVVLFSLTDDNYEFLSMNLQEVIQYIVSQKLIIKSYKDYYEPAAVENINN